MKTLLSFLVILTCLNINTKAQQKSASVSYATESHNFGKINEANGSVTYAFEFTNTGSEPLIISNVKASCGCTTPEWPKEPIAPGAKNVIKAIYNPEGRPGNFNKTITVTSNADVPTKVLTISGEVIPKVKKAEDYYPQKIGDLKIRSNHIAFSKLYSTEIKTDTMGVLNPTEKPVKITFENVPPHLKISIEPDVIQPNGKALISVTYDAVKKGEWGFNTDRIGFVIDGNNQPNNKISVRADIQENFENLTDEQKANAPKIVFEKTEYDFGTIKQNDVVDFTFNFKNEGKTDLMIRRTKASCGCTAIAPQKDVIKPGEESKFDVKFNSRGKKGKQHKTVTVITNDPVNPTTILKLNGDILVPESTEIKNDSK